MRNTRPGRLHVSLTGALLLTVLLGTPVTDSPVADAAQHGDAEQVRSLLRGGADVNAAQGDGMTALHWAARHDAVDIVDVLVYAGANLEATTRLGAYTPLHLAAREGNAATVDRLALAGADIEAETSAGITSLHFAAASGSTEAVTALLESGASVDIADGGSQRTALMFATAMNRLPVVELLIARGADPNLTTRVKDFAERSRMDGPERQRRNRIMAAQKETIDSNEGRNEASTPSATRETPAATRSTAQQRPDPDDPQPASASTQEEDEAEAEEEEPEEIDPESLPKASDFPVMTSVAERDAMGYADYVGRQGGLTALHYAARDGRMEAAVMLLDAGAELDRPTEGDGSTPLLMAAINGNYDLAMMLLERGADPNLLSDDGAGPLYATLNNRWAPKALYPQPTAFKQQQTDHLTLMRALLEAGAEVNRRLEQHIWYTSFNFDLLGVDFEGATPFWRAAYALDVPAMRLLVEFGADPGIPTAKPPSSRRSRSTSADPSGLAPVPAGGPAVFPIHAASGVGYGTSRAGNSHRHAPDAWLPAVKYLVEELGADVNQRDDGGYSAVHHAAARGDNELIRYLVEQGADVTFVSRRGQTTVDMANGPQQRVQPFPETIALLESLGAKNNNNCLSC